MTDAEEHCVARFALLCWNHDLTVLSRLDVRHFDGRPYVFLLVLVFRCKCLIHAKEMSMLLGTFGMQCGLWKQRKPIKGIILGKYSLKNMKKCDDVSQSSIIFDTSLVLISRSSMFQMILSRMIFPLPLRVCGRAGNYPKPRWFFPTEVNYIRTRTYESFILHRYMHT